MPKREGLQERRTKRGFTQESLAALLLVSPRTVRGWEAGTSAPYPEHRQPLADALDVTLDGLDRLLDGLSLDESGITSAARFDSTTVHTAGRGRVSVFFAGTSGGKRRSDNVEELLMNAAEKSFDFLTWVESTNVGDLTIEQMHTEVRRIAHAYLKVPTLPLFSRTLALRDRAFGLLSGHQAPRHARELYAAAGWSLTLLSWISVDLGRPDAAEDHARAAWMCAERADHNPLRAWVRATQHTAAFWQADYDTAAQHAADGLNYTGTGTAKLFLSSALALDLARAGHADRAESALLQAQQTAETVTRAEDELSGPLTCSLERAGSLWSDTDLVLGRADSALAYADRAVAAFEAAPDERRNRGSERMTRVQQVKAHLVLRDLASAEGALRPVLDTPPVNRVRPLVHRVTEVGTLATRIGGSTDATARRIHGAVTDFRRDTMTEELTA